MGGPNDYPRRWSRDINISPRTGSVSSVQIPPSPDPNQIPANAAGSTDSRRYAVEGSSSAQAIPNLPDESTIRPYPAAPKFVPLYAVVSDATSSCSSTETHYPRVRYIFSDDDPDILSGALAVQHHAVQSVEDSIPLEKNATGPSSRPIDLALPGITNRMLLLDLAAKENGRGYEVAWATSLSADWALTVARLSPLDPRPSDGMQEDDSQPMILNIEGISIASRMATSPSAQRAGTRGAATAALDGSGKPALGTNSDTSLGRDYAGLIGDFDKRMLLLKSSVQNAEDRQQQCFSFSKAQVASQ